MKAPSILIYGYGNPGRKDDGLGIRFVEEMELWNDRNGAENIHFDINYQLNPEDAIAVASHDVVLFVDASQGNIFDFTINKVKECGKVDFSTHNISPGYVMYLCGRIYRRLPAAYLLQIRGYEWQLEIGLTTEAERNLKQALEFVQVSIEKSALQNKGFFCNLQFQ